MDLSPLVAPKGPIGGGPNFRPFGKQSLTSKCPSHRSPFPENRTFTCMSCTCSCCCGACCYPDGTCAETLESECVLPVGTFQGRGTTCDPNPCIICSGQCEYEVVQDSPPPSGTGNLLWVQNIPCADTVNCDCEQPSSSPTSLGDLEYTDCDPITPP